MAKKKEESQDLFTAPVTESAEAVAPPKKKRGRPRKNPTPDLPEELKSIVEEV